MPTGAQARFLPDNHRAMPKQPQPDDEQLSTEEIEAWIKRLGEGGSSFPLDFLSLDALKNLALSLACLLHKSSTSKSSLGSQLEEPQPSTDSAEA